MKIGSFGDVVFEVSPGKTMTFRDFERSGSGRWDEHEIIRYKPRSEFQGPGLEEIKFTVLLKAELGINPMKELNKLRKMRDTGAVAPFIIGGKPISSNYFALQNLTERYTKIDAYGNVLAVEADLTLKEYVLTKKKTKTTMQKTAAKASSNATSKKKALGTITITVKSVHIRSGPSTSHKVIGYAYKGDTLTVYSEKNGWYSLGQGKYITANPKYSTFNKKG